jgi:CheY-like chemotaxis protein
MAAPLVAIMDDDEAFRELMGVALAGEGYRTLHISSSEDAAASIVRAQPALAILDLRMEHSYDGLAVLAAIRANRETATIPLILCSADIIHLREYQQALHAAVETLAQPFGLDELYARIASLLDDGKK